MATDERILSALQKIGAIGRELGVHLIAATQKPTAAAVGSLLKANLPLRLIGRVTSASEASTAAGLPGTGAERLSGRGDFLAVCSGRVVRFQAALPPTLPTAPGTPPPPLELPADPGPEIRDAGDDLVTRIAEVLRRDPGASMSAISREVSGRPYAGTAHVARIRAAYDAARQITGSTTTTENPSTTRFSAVVEPVSGSSSRE